MSSSGFVVTRAASAAANCFQVVTYESHKSRAKTPQSKMTIENDHNVDNKKDDRKGIDIKRARREIIKFGMTGFSTQKQQEARVALAISLGAKPPKNVNKNYKQILEEKKKTKKIVEKQKTMQLAGKNALGVSTAKKKFDFKNKPNDKSKVNILNQYGKATLNKNSNNRSGNVKKNNFNKKR